MASRKRINANTTTACPNRRIGTTTPRANPPVRGIIKASPYTISIGLGRTSTIRKSTRALAMPRKGLKPVKPPRITTSTIPTIRGSRRLPTRLASGLFQCRDLFTFSILYIPLIITDLVLPPVFYALPIFHFQVIHFPSLQVSLAEIVFLAVLDRQMSGLPYPGQISLVGIAYLPP